MSKVETEVSRGDVRTARVHRPWSGRHTPSPPRAACVETNSEDAIRSKTETTFWFSILRRVWQIRRVVRRKNKHFATVPIRNGALRDDAPPYRTSGNGPQNESEREATDDERTWRMRLTGELLKRKQRFTLIDAFAGAGGKTLGFSTKFGHAFVPVWANDIDPDCIETYNANFGNHGVCGDIFEVLNNPRTKIPKADVVIGGPPCQGVSNLNQKKNKGGSPRRELWRGFMELVERSDADVFVMENVPPFPSS